MKTVLALVIALTLLTACETMNGFGKDMQKGGRNLSDAADTLTP